MTAKSDALEDGILELILNNQPLTLVGDAAGLLASAADGDVFVSLHSSTGPGETGDQTTNEITTGEVTGYTRQAVPRDDTGWTVSAGTAQNDAAITFINNTVGSGILVTYVGIGTDPSAAGKLLWFGLLNTPIDYQVGVQAQFGINNLAISES